MPATAAEGILCTEDGQLLEGFISNLFVVQHSAAGLIVRTAVQGVLAGIKQSEVLGACEALGIAIVCKAPLQHERHLWVEAFLTNAVRGIRPVKRILCPADNAVGWKAWEVILPAVESQSVCDQLQHYLQQRCDVNLTQL